MLTQNGPLRLLEATDEHGRSLLPDGQDGMVTQRVSGYFGMSNGSTLSLAVPLSHPSQPSKTIKRLRGLVSIMVSTRKPDPLIVPLTDASGKSFQNDAVSLSINEVRTIPNTRQVSIDLSIRPQGTSAGSNTNVGGVGEFGFQRPDSHQQQIELVDAKGRTLPWYNTSYDGEGTRLTLTLVPHQDQTAPTELRTTAWPERRPTSTSCLKTSRCLDRTDDPARGSHRDMGDLAVADDRPARHTEHHGEQSEQAEPDGSPVRPSGPLGRRLVIPQVGVQGVGEGVHRGESISWQLFDARRQAASRRGSRPGRWREGGSGTRLDGLPQDLMRRPVERAFGRSSIS